MIVTCPACAARYQFDEERLEGRSAKITCPSCDHVFVTHPPKVEPTLSADTWPSEAMDENAAAKVLADPELDIRTADFTTVGVVWKVRQGLGIIRDFHTLAALEEAMDDGLVGRSDDLSYDGRQYVGLGSIADLEAHFRDIWDRAARGEVKTEDAQHFVIGEDADDEDEDAPTTIVRTGNQMLADLDDDDFGRAPPAADDAFSAPGDTYDDNGGPSPLALQPTPSAIDDPPTEDVSTDAHGEAPAAVPTTPPAPKPAAADGRRSVLPIVLLVLVVLVILGVILYQQGMFGDLGG